MELKVNGLKVFAYTGGRQPDSNAPWVVFIHGAAHDHSVWNLQSRYLAHHGRNVLAVDLPGHGRSAGQPLESITALADWLLATLGAAGIASAALIGHSMGSLITLEAAARAPERIRRLALIGTGVPMPVSESLLATSRETPEAAFRMVNQWSHAPASLIGGHPVPGLWMTGMNLALMRRSQPGTLHTDLANCNAYQNGLAAAAKVRCPALIVLGKRDLMTPAKATADLLKTLPDVRSTVVEGAGHAMMSEQPAAVLSALLEFV